MGFRVLGLGREERGIYRGLVGQSSGSSLLLGVLELLGEFVGSFGGCWWGHLGIIIANAVLVQGAVKTCIFCSQVWRAPEDSGVCGFRVAGLRVCSLGFRVEY